MSNEGFMTKTRKRLSVGASNVGSAMMNPVHKRFTGSASTDTEALKHSEAILLADAAVSIRSRTNQDEDDLRAVQKRIEEMLATATDSRVHIDKTEVDRMEGHTDYVLSDDSRWPKYAQAIRDYAVAHFDSNVFEIYEREALIKQRRPDFPVAHSEMHTTLVIRVHAVLITYTAMRFWWRKVRTLSLFAGICACAYVNSIMVLHEVRY